MSITLTETIINSDKLSLQMRFRDVAIIIFYDKENRLLLQERGDHSKHGEEWAFFGGKIEEGETPFQAVVRETKEELDYDLENPEYLGIVHNEPVPDLRTTLNVFIAPLPPTELFTVNEGKGYGLFTPDDACALKLLKGDEKVIRLVESALAKKAS